jgi:hypothetical protein
MNPNRIGLAVIKTNYDRFASLIEAVLPEDDKIGTLSIKVEARLFFLESPSNC